jgi:hypothetical protein
LVEEDTVNGDTSTKKKINIYHDLNNGAREIISGLERVTVAPSRT